MKLPRGGQAIVDMRKLLDYCLSAEHPRGRNKARVFAAAGITPGDAVELRAALLAAAAGGDAQLSATNMYGQRYVIDFDLFRRGRTVRIRSAWIVRDKEDLPRLTSCYVL